MEQDSFSDLVGNLQESRKIAEGILADCKDVKLCEVLQEELTRIETSIQRLSKYTNNNLEETNDDKDKTGYIIYSGGGYSRGSVISNSPNEEQRKILNNLLPTWEKQNKN